MDLYSTHQRNYSELQEKLIFDLKENIACIAQITMVTYICWSTQNTLQNFLLAHIFASHYYITTGQKLGCDRSVTQFMSQHSSYYAKINYSCISSLFGLIVLQCEYWFWAQDISSRLHAIMLKHGGFGYRPPHMRSSLLFDLHLPIQTLYVFYMRTLEKHPKFVKGICPRGNNNMVIIIFRVYVNVYFSCQNCISQKH